MVRKLVNDENRNEAWDGEMVVTESEAAPVSLSLLSSGGGGGGGGDIWIRW